MKPEDMEEDQAGSFHGTGELGQGHWVCHLAEMVHNIEDGCVAVRQGQTGGEVQGDVGPRTMWYGACL